MGQIIVRCVGGLGNRILSLACGLVAAEHYGCSFAYSWSLEFRSKLRGAKDCMPLALDDLWDNDLYECSEDDRERIEADEDVVVYSTGWRKEHKLFPTPPKDGTMVLWGHGPFPIVEEDHGIFALHGDQSSSKSQLMEQISTQLRKHLTFKSNAASNKGSAAAEEFAAKLFNGRPVSALQLRALGVHLNRRGLNPVKHFKGRCREMLDVNPKQRIYLSCDCQETVAEFKREFGGAVWALPKPDEVNTVESLHLCVAELQILMKADDYHGTLGSGWSYLAWLLRDGVHNRDTARGHFSR